MSPAVSRSTNRRVSSAVAALALAASLLVSSLPASAQADPIAPAAPAPGDTSAVATQELPAQRPEKVRITKLVVVLREQKVYAYTTVKGRHSLVSVMPVSTGLDNSTPTGTFQVFSRRSRTFYRAKPSEKMNWMTRFTKGKKGDNIGFHGIPYTVDKKGRKKPHFTPLGERPSSHGCIRLADADARWIFSNVKVKSRRNATDGTMVVVVRSLAA